MRQLTYDEIVAHCMAAQEARFKSNCTFAFGMPVGPEDLHSKCRMGHVAQMRTAVVLLCLLHMRNASYSRIARHMNMTSHTSVRHMASKCLGRHAAAIHGFVAVVQERLEQQAQGQARLIAPRPDSHEGARVQ